MTNKEILLKFYDEVFNGWDLSHIDDYMRDDYKQHSFGVKDGKAGFMEFITEFVKKKPHAEICKILEDGDMVCLYFKCSFADGSNAKVFDLFRLVDGKLAEHWDCPMSIDNVTTAHNNGQF